MSGLGSSGPRGEEQGESKEGPGVAFQLGVRRQDAGQVVYSVLRALNLLAR